MHKIIKFSFFFSISLCFLAMITILITFVVFKPNLPEIKYVDESELQMPLKVFSKDGVLIGEFGEIKRRSTEFNDIPDNIKNAFLAAEDDNFFNHQGISYSALLRSFIRCASPSGCQGGGGTITMQVVRGYLLTREQTITRKIKEIFLALELEGINDKEEIFELYVNRIFLGNRSYGIEAAANTYFNKNLNQLDVGESATIAAIAQLPSRVNPVKNLRRTTQRRNWILSRMLLLKYIDQEEYEMAISKEINIAKNINLYDIEANHLAELVRQEVINRYGLRAYKEGWEVYTTIDSNSQRIAYSSLLDELFTYDKRHGWRESDNYQNVFSEEEINSLVNLNTDFLTERNFDENANLNENIISNRLNKIFDSYSFYKTHTKGIIIKVSEKRISLIDENFDIKNVEWSEDYSWAKKQISIDKLDKKPNGFDDFLSFGDFVYLKNNKGLYSLDQVPIAEASLISINPNSGEVIAYIGGKNFDDSNFDRVRLSFPQSGSSFKPFIYSSGLANGYNLSSLINDAPIVFEDENLESEWRPQNYTGEFYGLISMREALTKSVNIVSIKLLRELGIENSHAHIQKFGFKKSRLPNDLSLALGSGNFSPAEMVRGYSVIANDGFISDMHYIDSIRDRFGNFIYSYEELTSQNTTIDAFPWLDTVEMNLNRPYYIIQPLNLKERVVDERITYLIEDVLRGFLSNGVAGRKSEFLKRDDIGGKTGTTNDSVSTWFSGFHKDLVTTVWVGTDDFTSLGNKEFGSTIALPIWLNYMDFKLNSLEQVKRRIPENITFARVNKSTGEIDTKSQDNSYFELFLNENVN